MNKQLNQKYFKTIYSETVDNYDYLVIKPLDNPMILFSVVEGQPVVPLASLHLRCQDTFNNDKEAKALITKRPSKSEFKCDFQGIINKDGQEFEFVITNLCNDGYINFNILKQDTKVNMVDPGGLNQVNELRPFESQVVKCDQKDNRKLILSSIYKNDKKGKSVKVTVGEDESSKDEKQGTYYYLSVVPQIDKLELVNNFKQTKWACVDLFCMKSKVKPKMTQFGSNRDRHSLFSNASEFVSRSISAGNYTNTNNNDGFWADHDNLELDNSCTTIYDKFGNPYPEEESDEDIGFDLYGNIVSQQTKSVKQDIIKDSYASTVLGGEKIDVTTVFTGIEYSYDSASESCVIGLSISDKIEFNDNSNDDYLLELAKEIITDVIKNASKEMLGKITRIYKSDECSICLESDEERRLDAIFYQCGHQCCHYECSQKLDKCPLCRGTIKGLIKDY